MFKKISEENLNKTILKLSSYFNRNHNQQTGLDAVLWLQQDYQAFIDTLPVARKNMINISLFRHTWLQPSLIIKIMGSKNSSIGEEIVAIGSHIDSTAGGNTRSPGADDDASGSATVFEAFKVLASDEKFIPERTVEFHHYAAEEAGLLGSQAMAQKYKADGKNVHGVLQLDMTGYNPPANNNRVGIITDFTNPELNQLLRRVVQTYGELPYGDTRCGYACSDHASWNRAGYRSSFGFEVGVFNMLNPNIHTANDLLIHLDMKRCAKYVKFAIGFIVELSD